MIYVKRIIFVIFFNLVFLTQFLKAENFFLKKRKKFEKKDYEKSKFLFQRNIVFNPKDAKSYLYLAKIFKNEDNQEEEEKFGYNTSLDPENEEAIYVLINIQLDRSNFEKANDLMDRFSNICKTLCSKKTEISKSLQDFEANNEKTN